MPCPAKIPRRHFLALAAVLPFGLPVAAQPAPPAPQQAFASWSEAFAADWVRQVGEYASGTQYFSGAEAAAFERQLTPITAERRDARLALARRGLKELAALDRTGWSADDQVGAGIIGWQLQRVLDNAPYDDHDFMFDHRGGMHLRYVSLLAENHPLRRPQDLESFGARLAQVPTRLDEAIAWSRAAAARGLLPPRFILEKSRAQVQQFLAQGPADNDIVAGLARRSARIEGLAAADRQAAIDSATALVKDRVRPAYERVLAYLNELHPRTTADAGLWRLPDGDKAYAQALAQYLPDGDKAYAQALAQYTTTRMTADEIHALGLREVARIEAEMDRVLRGLGRKEGSVEARMQALRAELQPPAEPDPRPMILARYTGAVRDAERRADALFNLKPKAPVEVRRVPALTERTASAYYTTPAPDGSRPGVFWAPLPGPSYDMLRIRSLAVHEAVPGHHFQLALQLEQTTLPRWRQRRIFGGGSAHSEGWGLYAELLALDNGWYDGDPHALLGGLDGQLFRARRLVVDTGLHARRWTREQAIAYGLPEHEVERYVSNPGQACAYMVGMLHMLAVREEARKTLGARFDIKAFHDVVLKTGSVPLEVLSDVVRRWAAQVA